MKDQTYKLPGSCAGHSNHNGSQATGFLFYSISQILSFLPPIIIRFFFSLNDWFKTKNIRHKGACLSPKLFFIIYFSFQYNVCVCVCERERERESIFTRTFVYPLQYMRYLRERVRLALFGKSYLYETDLHGIDLYGIELHEIDVLKIECLVWEMTGLKWTFFNPMGHNFSQFSWDLWWIKKKNFTPYLLSCFQRGSTV